MKQLYDRYTAEDLKVWSILFDRQVKNLQDKGSCEYLYALNEMQTVLNAGKLPNFEEIDTWFSTRTGWTIECVPGLIPVDAFFELLAEKKFPSSTWLRSLEKLDYLEEPDMFHDIFGHIPLLSQPEYSDFVQRFGQLGKSMIHDEEKLLMLQRLYWFTIEFGLINETKGLRIYGAGILSSFGESISSLNGNVETVAFDTQTIVHTSFCTSEMQQKYFILESMEQLNESIYKLQEEWSSNTVELNSKN